MSFSISINPGSGPALGATEADAVSNIRQFVADLGERGIPATFQREEEEYDYGDGRYAFTVITSEDDVEFVVQMPGLPLDQVRWLGRDQDIWQFPRLYVDGASWIWYFALNQFEDDDAPRREPNNTVCGGEPYVAITAAEAGERDDD